MNAAMSIPALRMPGHDRISKLLIDMITDCGHELAELPPIQESTPYERQRRDDLLLRVTNYRGDLRRQRWATSR